MRRGDRPVVHYLNHLGQIVQTMAKRYSQAVAPWRGFQPIIDASQSRARCPWLLKGSRSLTGILAGRSISRRRSFDVPR
jgi:hypothetical protein